MKAKTGRRDNGNRPGGLPAAEFARIPPRPPAPTAVDKGRPIKVGKVARRCVGRAPRTLRPGREPPRLARPGRRPTTERIRIVVKATRNGAGPPPGTVVSCDVAARGVVRAGAAQIA